MAGGSPSFESGVAGYSWSRRHGDRLSRQPETPSSGSLKGREKAVNSGAAVEREICALLPGPCRATGGRSRFVELHIPPPIKGHVLEKAHQTRPCAWWLVQAHKRTARPMRHAETQTTARKPQGQCRIRDRGRRPGVPKLRDSRRRPARNWYCSTDQKARGDGKKCRCRRR